MRVYLILLLAVLLGAPPTGAAAKKKPDPAPAGYENRCGWVDNPTPANWWLTDRDATWIIGAQGGHQAFGDIPEFPAGPDYWVKTNGSYGYGCGCMLVKTDAQEKHVLEIRSGEALPLAKCRADKTLRSKPR